MSSSPLRSVATPNQPDNFVVCRLDEDRPYRLWPPWIVEAHAQIALVCALLDPTPHRADLGGAEHHTEVRCALILLSVVGDNLDAGVDAECSDRSGVAVVNGRESSNDGHALRSPLSVCSERG